MQVRTLGQEDPLHEGMATHFSILAWKFHGQRSLVDHRLWGWTWLSDWVQHSIVNKLIKAKCELACEYIMAGRCRWNVYIHSQPLCGPLLDILRKIKDTVGNWRESLKMRWHGRENRLPLMERHRTLWSCSESSVSCHVEQNTLNQKGKSSNTIIPRA